jgi:hypothetical protein
MMVAESSLPCSEDPFTDPYPEPDQSRQYCPFLLSKIHFTVILPPMFCHPSCISPFWISHHLHSSSPAIMLHSVPVFSSPHSNYTQQRVQDMLGMEMASRCRGWL